MFLLKQPANLYYLERRKNLSLNLPPSTHLLTYLPPSYFMLSRASSLSSLICYTETGIKTENENEIETEIESARKTGSAKENAKKIENESETARKIDKRNETASVIVIVIGKKTKTVKIAIAPTVIESEKTVDLLAADARKKVERIEVVLLAEKTAVVLLLEDVIVQVARLLLLLLLQP